MTRRMDRKYAKMPYRYNNSNYRRESDRFRLPKHNTIKPSLSYIPRGDGRTYHPPGPGIGLRPGPAPALGRPGILPRDHGGWKNRSCFSQGSKSWKPDILSIGTAHICPGIKGPQSPYRPPNISNDIAGYNTKLFPNEHSVANILKYLGYKGSDGNSMIRMFQRHWNLVISRIAILLDSYKNVFIAIPQGNLQIDGKIGPNTLNAIEIAAINQNSNSALKWPKIVTSLYSENSDGYGKERIYNAAQWCTS